MHSLRDVISKVADQVDSVPPGAIPSRLSEGRVFKDIPLHPHQVEGIHWMLRRWIAKRSIIVADEMGLGKTLQTLAFVAYLMDHCNVTPPFLVIAPLSVAPQWTAQARQFVPSLRMFEYFGSADAREEKRRYIIEDNIMCLPSPMRDSADPQPLPFDVMVSTYETCLGDIAFVGKFKWRMIVFDEGHRLKNAESVTHKTFLSQFCSSAYKVILTGTPVQNNCGEFLALLHFLDPELFDPNVLVDDEQILHPIVKALVLRRLFVDIQSTISLPPIEEIVVRTQMTPLQTDLYQWALFHARGSGESNSVPPGLMSNVMMTLRKIASHPYLIPGVEPEPFTEGAHVFEVSNKFTKLQELLAEMQREQARALIFSSFTSLLDICQDMLEWQKVPYERLDGSVRGEDRVDSLARFGASESTPVFLLSTRAGGVGLNLASANWVIFLDSDWNPQVDLQAIARVFRQGQTRPVKVFRLVSIGTIDEVILARGAAKLQLARVVLTSDDNHRPNLSEPADWQNQWSDLDQASVARIDALLGQVKPAASIASAKPKDGIVQVLTDKNRERRKLLKWQELNYTSLAIPKIISETSGFEGPSGSLTHLHGSLVEPCRLREEQICVVCHVVDASGIWPKHHRLFSTTACTFPTAPRLYAKAKRAGDLNLGDVHVVTKENNFLLALLVSSSPDEFKRCLQSLAAHFEPPQTVFHFARVGEQRGTLYRTERLINRYLCQHGFDVYMYYFSKPSFALAKKTLLDYFSKSVVAPPPPVPKRILVYSVSSAIPDCIAEALKRDIVSVLDGAIGDRNISVYVTSISEPFKSNCEISIPNCDRDSLWSINSETLEYMIAQKLRTRIV